jgi:hypothetical protein
MTFDKQLETNGLVDCRICQKRLRNVDKKEGDLVSNLR